MNREIKFRAWDGESQRMVFWTLNDLLCRFGEDEYKDERKDCSPFFRWMQYTGLKDKNGKEIYEGDIVKDYCGNNHEIKWGGAEVDIKGCGHGEDWCELTTGWSFNKEPAEIYKKGIIGNIHENPELLK